MKINYACIARSLIALLFVVAGVQKLMNFAQTSENIGSLGFPLPGLVTLLVIIIEIPVALAFAWGYKVRITGWILVAFTVIATIVVHGQLSQGMNFIMALKNIAIIGGIMSAIACVCKDCMVHTKKGNA